MFKQSATATMFIILLKIKLPYNNKKHHPLTLFYKNTGKQHDWYFINAVLMWGYTSNQTENDFKFSPKSSRLVIHKETVMNP